MKKEFKKFVHDDVNSHRVKLLTKTITRCLTKKHNECSGSYIDLTDSFCIVCSCKCHLRERADNNEKENYENKAQQK